MEIMYISKSNNLFKKNKFTGIYKDKLDLINQGIEFNGISYDDNWSVKRFLNGYNIILNKEIINLFDELEISENLLKIKIKNLTKSQYKLVLLVYMLINDKNIYVLDYFDKGLDFKTKTKIINFLKSKYTKTLIVISNDMVFLNNLCSELIIINDDKIIYNDVLNNIYKSNIKIETPEIIKFIRLANKKKAKLTYTVDNKELLKDIYRSIK